MKEEVCQVRFFIDEKGVPYDVKIEKCPKVFHAEIQSKAYKARFYPLKSNGKSIKGCCASIRFKLRRPLSTVVLATTPLRRTAPPHPLNQPRPPPPNQEVPRWKNSDSSKRSPQRACP